MEHARIFHGFSAKIGQFTPFERPTVRRILKSVIALLTAMSIPLVATAPASASAPDLSTLTFDCDEYSWRPFPVIVPIYGASVTVEFDNCPSLYKLSDPLNTGFGSTTAGDVDSSGTVVLDDVTVDDEVAIYVLDENADAFAILEFTLPYEMPNPDGTQLADTLQSLPADAPHALWGSRSQIQQGDEISLGRIDGCEIMPGEHIYATQSFTVTTAGDYTFRVTGVDPVSHYFDPEADGGSELDDPMVALYSTFNTLDPASGLVGCNDDLNDLVVDGHDYDEDINPFTVSEQGDYIEGHYSYFSSTLDPGDYMLVFTTWDNVSASEWASETPGGGTVYFDVWGPTGGANLTDVDPISVPVADGSGRLADTGVEPAMALWSGLFLVAAGAVIMIARRRAQRA